MTIINHSVINILFVVAHNLHERPSYDYCSVNQSYSHIIEIHDKSLVLLVSLGPPLQPNDAYHLTTIKVKVSSRFILFFLVFY